MVDAWVQMHFHDMFTIERLRIHKSFTIDPLISLVIRLSKFVGQRRMTDQDRTSNDIPDS